MNLWIISDFFTQMRTLNFVNFEYFRDRELSGYKLSEDEISVDKITTGKLSVDELSSRYLSVT